MTTTEQPAGWYPDQEDPSLLRYWDGSMWTKNRAPIPPPTAPPPPPQWDQPMPPPYLAGQVPGMSAFAVASFVLSLVWLYGVGAILAIIFGHISLNHIRKRGERGRGLAIAGLIIGYVGLAGLIAVIIVAATVSNNNNCFCTN